MTEQVVVGTPLPRRLDWSMIRGADFVASLKWSRDGAPVDLTGAVVLIEFSTPPTNGVVPATISTTGTNTEGGHVILGDAAAPANMTVSIPATATATYRFKTIRYAMTVTFPGSGTLRWAEGDVSFEDGP